MKLTDDQKRLAMAHLQRGKKLWDDETKNTPGDSFEDFMMNSYGPAVAGSKAPRKQQKKDKAGPLQRYVSYLFPKQKEMEKAMTALSGGNESV